MRFRKHTMIEAIFKAHEVNQEIIKFIDTIVAECGKAEALLRELCGSGGAICCHQGDRSSGRDGSSRLHRRQADERREHPTPSPRSWKRHLRISEEWLAVIGEKLFTSIRRRPSVR